MQFNPSLQPNEDIHYQELSIAPEKEVTIPPGIAFPFQVQLFAQYFKDAEEKAVTPLTLDDEKILWFVGVYGEAFRSYCEQHADVSREIILGTLTSKKENDLVTYMQTHPRKQEEVDQEYEAMEKKYRVH